MQIGRMILVALLVFAILGIIDYQLLRWAVAGIALYLMYKVHENDPEEKLSGEIILYWIIIITYNPLVPIYLYSRELWIIIDLIFLGFLLPIILKDSETVKAPKERNLIDEIGAMTDQQRRKYLDEALKYDPLSMNSWDYEEEAFLDNLEEEITVAETAFSKVYFDELKILTDLILEETNEINELVSLSETRHWFDRYELFKPVNHWLILYSGWKLYNPYTDELIGVGFRFEDIMSSKDFDSDHERFYRIMILTFPEYLHLNVENVELKLINLIENEAREEGIEKLHIDVSRFEYIAHLYNRGYREPSDLTAEELERALIFGEKTIVCLEKNLT